MVGGAAGAAGGGSQTIFHVPTDGGTVQFTGASGQPIEFEFPAAAAGMDITLAPGDATDLGWDAGSFSEVIFLGPDHATFDPPIIVRPSSKDVLLLDFPNSSTQSAPDGLAYNAAEGGFELHHFSALAVVPPDKSCDSQTGWQEDPSSASCAEAGDDHEPSALRL